MRPLSRGRVPASDSGDDSDDLERLCTRCGRRAERPLAVDARCPACEQAYVDDAPSRMRSLVRAAPAAGASAILGGLLGLVTGATVAGLVGAEVGALLGMLAGAAWGGRATHRALEGHRRTLFLRGPQLPQARMLDDTND